MSDNYIKTVGDLRNALEEFEDDDYVDIAIPNPDYDSHAIITKVVRDNCDPLSPNWCAQIYISQWSN